MIYFDSDLLVHYFANYEATKHEQAAQLIQRATYDKTFCTSLLCVQETSFALAKIFALVKRKNGLADINQAVNQLIAINPMGYNTSHFQRALQIAQHLGFQHINDCLHTALAESQNCSELITYNRKDFVRIQPLTNVKITIL